MTTTTEPTREVVEKTHERIAAEVESLLTQAWDPVSSDITSGQILLEQFNIEPTEETLSLAYSTRKISIVALVLLAEILRLHPQGVMDMIDTQGQRQTLTIALQGVKHTDAAKRYTLRLLGELRELADGTEPTGFVDASEAFNAVASRLESSQLNFFTPSSN